MGFGVVFHIPRQQLLDGLCLARRAPLCNGVPAFANGHQVRFGRIAGLNETFGVDAAKGQQALFGMFTGAIPKRIRLRARGQDPDAKARHPAILSVPQPEVGFAVSLGVSDVLLCKSPLPRHVLALVPRRQYVGNTEHNQSHQRKQDHGGKILQ